MSDYRFLSSERTTAKGNECEAMALLHLLCFADCHDEVNLFAVDCFNDVTGMDSHCVALHDVQAKAGQKLTPAELGRDLVTLLENRMSPFASYFVSYTLFVGGVSSTCLEDETLEEFGFHHLTQKAQQSAQKRLVEEYDKRLERNKKLYGEDAFPDAQLTEDVLDEFLGSVRFVIAKKDTADYIRPLIRTKTKVVPEDAELRHIFTQIRDMQSKYKNRKAINGKTIKSPREVMDSNRILHRRKIELLVIERLLDRDYLGKDTPKCFKPYLNSFAPDEDLSELVEDCRNALSMLFFDKNGRDAFWSLFDEVVSVLDRNPGAGITEIVSLLDNDVVNACPPYMDRRSLHYLVAMLKDGLKS